jgi:hypothetical protein
MEQHRNRLSGAAYIMGFARGTTLKSEADQRSHGQTPRSTNSRR